MRKFMIMVGLVIGGCTELPEKTPNDENLLKSNIVAKSLKLYNSTGRIDDVAIYLKANYDVDLSHEIKNNPRLLQIYNERRVKNTKTNDITLGDLQAILND